MVSNMTVGELKEILDKYDDNLEVIASGIDRLPLDLSSITFTSYNPEGLVELDHINGPVLCVCLNLETLKVGV